MLLQPEFFANAFDDRVYYLSSLLNISIADVLKNLSVPAFACDKRVQRNEDKMRRSLTFQAFTNFTGTSEIIDLQRFVGEPFC